MLQLDVLGKLVKILKSNKRILYTYIGALLFIFIVYSPKLFFEIYAPDDYSNYGWRKTWFSCNDWLGRWAASLMNYSIFYGELHILPYLNALLSLILLSGSSLIACFIWGIKNRVLIFTILLVNTISPYWANNLWFNTNASVALGLFSSVIGTYFIVKKFKWWPLGIFLVAFGIGTYQIVLINSVVIVIGWLLIQWLETEGEIAFKQSVFRFVKIGGALVLSYALSHFINSLTLLAVGEQVREGARYADALKLTIWDILYLIRELYKNVLKWYTLPLPYFSGAINGFNIASILLGSITFVVSIKDNGRIYLSKIVLFLGIVIGLVLALKLPQIIGMTVPPRAFFPMSTLICVFWVVVYKSRYKLLTSIGVGCFGGGGCIAIWYISIFFYGGYRQTQADLDAARTIVTHIREYEGYDTYKTDYEFLIVGIGNEQFFQVKEVKTSSAFSFDWSKYSIFKNFTNFNFKVCRGAKAKEILREVTPNLQSYPSQQSITIIDNTIVLMLDDEVDLE